MNKKIVIIGASGHGKVVADIAQKSGYERIVFLDDDVKVKKCGNYSVVGTRKEAALYREFDFVVAIGNANIRQKVYDELVSEKLHICTLIHPDAVIAEDVLIGKGTVIMAGVVINSEARIGRGCIINTCASVDHDCVIDDLVHISVGAHIAGTVQVGIRTWIGAGATVSNNVNITSDCMIGAGTVVIKDVRESGTYIGVPAERIR